MAVLYGDWRDQGLYGENGQSEMERRSGYPLVLAIDPDRSAV